LQAEFLKHNITLQSVIDMSIWFFQSTTLNMLDHTGNPMILQKIYNELSTSGSVVVEAYIHQLADAMITLENIHSTI
jgi:hypothetical protein